VDHFDDFCEHLLVRDQVTQKGGHLPPADPQPGPPRRGLYSEGEFDCSALAPLRNDMVELGRSCVHQDYRSGAAILALWGALADFMRATGCSPWWAVPACRCTTPG
jgi:putative hemolysin